MTIFRKKFVTEKRLNHWQDELLKLKQKGSLTNYIDKFKNLYRKLEREENRLSEGYLKNLFIKGLRRPLAKRIMEEDYESVEDIIRKAKRIERGEKYGEEEENKLTK